MSNNPKIKDPDFITPDLDWKELITILAKREQKNSSETKKDQDIGELIFRSIGNKITFANAGGNEIPNLDVHHASADPFRDADVDTERVNSKGLVNRATLENRDVLFLQNIDFGYILPYLGTDQETADTLATFLLRVPNKQEGHLNYDRLDKITFAFRDPTNHRDPFIILNKEKSSSDPIDKK